MQIRAVLIAAVVGTALAACGDATPVEPAAAPALGVNSTRTGWVNAVTYGYSLGNSAGYAKGWATPVGNGTGYEMGDVEANGNDGKYMTENIGYTGQLDAFRYDSGCTIRWLSGARQISTAATIYLANYPNASNFTLEINC
jgi:hypothetical protein